MGGSVEIVELSVAHGPKEGGEAKTSHHQGEGNEDQQPRHRAARASRSELAITTNELADIASAAISGVT